MRPQISWGKRFVSIMLLLPFSPLTAFSQPPLPVLFVRGDSNGDGPLDLSDAVFTLEYLFLSGPAPSCLEACDSNDDGAVDLSDPIHHLAALFLAGPPPAAPYPDCGKDLTADGLGCGSFPACEFQSLVSAYSTLKTVAGLGALANDVNEWNPAFEGGPAVQAELSAPHMAMADDSGNIYIADKDAHAIRKVALDGRITTVAGTNAPGDDGDDPGPGTERRLSSPNGLFVRGDSTLYILDMGNGKVRKLDPAGTLTTLFTVPGGIAVGRGLWVSPDESLVYFSSNTDLKKWTPADGVTVVSGDFSSLGNIAVDPSGNLVATDRVGDRVYRVSAGGALTPIAGNGTSSGGGDGQRALDTGLDGVRGVWFLPHGGYFLATHEGNRVWYVDTRGIIHLFLNGRQNAHSGDGARFDTPGFKVSECRAVTVDPSGNVLVTEHDAGYVRMVVRAASGS